jgi:hypothetical protein
MMWPALMVEGQGGQPHEFPLAMVELLVLRGHHRAPGKQLIEGSVKVMALTDLVANDDGTDTRQVGGGASGS